MDQNEGERERKPVAAAMVETGTGSYLMVVCDDGSVWRNAGTGPKTNWREMVPPVPGTARAREFGRR